MNYKLSRILFLIMTIYVNSVMPSVRYYAYDQNNNKIQGLKAPFSVQVNAWSTSWIELGKFFAIRNSDSVNIPANIPYWSWAASRKMNTLGITDAKGTKATFAPAALSALYSLVSNLQANYLNVFIKQDSNNYTYLEFELSDYKPTVRALNLFNAVYTNAHGNLPLMLNSDSYPLTVTVNQKTLKNITETTSLCIGTSRSSYPTNGAVVSTLPAGTQISSFVITDSAKNQASLSTTAIENLNTLFNNLANTQYIQVFITPVGKGTYVNFEVLGSAISSQNNVPNLTLSQLQNIVNSKTYLQEEGDFDLPNLVNGAFTVGKLSIPTSQSLVDNMNNMQCQNGNAPELYLFVLAFDSNNNYISDIVGQAKRIFKYVFYAFDQNGDALNGFPYQKNISSNQSDDGVSTNFTVTGLMDQATAVTYPIGIHIKWHMRSIWTPGFPTLSLTHSKTNQTFAIRYVQQYEPNTEFSDGIETANIYWTNGTNYAAKANPMQKAVSAWNSNPTGQLVLRAHMKTNGLINYVVTKAYKSPNNNNWYSIAPAEIGHWQWDQSSMYGDAYALLQSSNLPINNSLSYYMHLIKNTPYNFTPALKNPSSKTAMLKVIDNSKTNKILATSNGMACIVLNPS